MTNHNIPTNFKAMHLNIRGIRSKLNELKLFIKAEKPDFISLNETFLKPSFKVKIDGYNIIRKDRVYGSHGGVAIIIKDTIITKEIIINNTTKTDNEFLIIEALIPNKNQLNKLIISTIYCPKGKPCKNIIDNIALLNDNLIIMGDFNSKHTSFGSTKTDPSGQILYNLIQNNNFYPVNDDSPTHYDTYRDKFDVLDFIFVSNNILHQLSNYYTDDNLGSDHFSMFAIFGKVNKDKTPSIKNIKLYHKTNWEHFNEHLTKSYHDYPSNNQPNLNDINMITKHIDNTSEWLTNNIKNNVGSTYSYYNN